jgi:hypothetical protein
VARFLIRRRVEVFVMARPRRALEVPKPPKPIDQDDIPTAPGWTLDGHQAAKDHDEDDDDDDANVREEVTRER